MKGKLTTNLSLTANTSIPRVVHEGGASTWNEITGKPFSRVDTENGLAIYDNTLMIDTLDKIATIDYVNEQIADIDLSDYATKTELDAVEAEIPSLTGYATEQYVDTAISSIPDPTWNDIQNKPIFATVATSGDYDDLSNKPTIPSIDGLATETYVNDAIAAIDIPTDVSELNNDAGYITSSALNGYATEQYVDDAIADIPAPTVEIDNKSIIKNQDDELQTAANLYYEDITTTYNAIKGWSGSAFQQDATNSDYAKAIYADSSVISDNTHYYDVMVNFVPRNEANAITVKGKINYIKLNTNNIAVGDLSEYFTTIRVDSNGGHAWSSTSKIGSINWIIFPTIPYKSGYETDDVDYTERVYNQLSAGYIPVDDTIKYVDGKLHIFNDILTKGIAGTYSIDVNTNFNVTGYPLKPVRLSVKHNQTIIDSSADSTGMNIVTGGELGLPVGKSSSYFNFTRSNPTYVITMPENTFDNQANRYIWIGIGYVPQSFSTGFNNTSYTSWIYGRMWIGDITNDNTDFNIEGIEAVLDSWVFDATQNKYIVTFKSTIYPKHIVHWYYSSTADRSNPEYQKMNSFFLPLDNSTIVRDSDGNIKTAIPAPPTTDGNYTLAVTVTNGEPTYSWV